jgi:hypothetical protein
LYHADQKRLSGEPYYTHPVEVAYLIIKYSDSGYRLTTEIIVAAILHDIVEDTDFSLEMVKLEFSNEVAEIVSGLTRVKPDKKLTIPESIEAVFNKQYSFLSEEKVPLKTALSLFLIDCAMPVFFYLTYIHFGTFLKTKFGYNGGEVIFHNFKVGIIYLICAIIQTFLTGKIHPLKILKVRLFIFAIFVILYKYLLSKVTTPFHLLMFQAFIMTFAPTNFPAVSVFFKHFPIFKRFTYAGALHAISHAMMYVVTSFGFVYLVREFGQAGILFIVVPICIGFSFGLYYFEKLEIKTGNY